jgi:iron complex outermembrane receptor protein
MLIARLYGSQNFCLTSTSKIVSHRVARGQCKRCAFLQPQAQTFNLKQIKATVHLPHKRRNGEKTVTNISLGQLRAGLKLSAALLAILAVGVARAKSNTSSMQAVGSGTDLQDTAEQPVDRGISKIVVSARKRVENVQDVATSVSAVSAEQLETRFDMDLRDFANIVPNIIIDHVQQGTGGVASITIRGIGIADVEKVIDPTVGVGLDDIYLGTSSGGLVKAIDIDRPEVLRGPQGTLFGRNAIAGGINLGRLRPTQKLSGKFRLAVVSRSWWKFVGGVISG